MKLLQICPSLNKSCGVRFFSENLHHFISNYCEVQTVSEVSHPKILNKFDSCIIHYTNKISKIKAQEIQKNIKTFLFLHNTKNNKDLIKGNYFILNKLAKTNHKNYLIPHPCYTEKIQERFELKKEKKLESKIIIGTCGFYSEYRKLFEICKFLIDNLDERYFIYLSCTPHFKWNSSKIINKLKKISEKRIFINEKQLSHKEINHNMQMCDLVWCWTSSPLNNYGSGVASDLYGSGTKMIVQQKPQHEHIIDRRKNVIKTENNFSSFLEIMLKESLSCQFEREIDNSISWQKISKLIFKIINQKLL